MPVRRWPRRTVARPRAISSARRAALVFLLFFVIAGSTVFGLALRSMVTEYAAAAARDEVVTQVNEIVKTLMIDPRFAGTNLVNLERDGNGDITAVTTNVVAINTLAAEVLSQAIQKTEKEVITVDIPLVNLLGSAILMNHGPSISVHVTMLSSSTAGFRSELTSAGINQTRHQLFLDLNVQLSFLLPWRGMETSVHSEILVSETVIVGDVPNSYLNWER